MPYQLRAAAAAASTLLLLSACGGGGEGDKPQASAKTTPDSVTISGVAATGLALDGATVSAKCATGSGSTVTDASGRYSLTVEGQLPCLLEASSGSVRLHSIATNGTAQISPLTTLLVAHVGGKDPAAYFASLSAGPSLADALRDQAITQAQLAVKTLTTDAGIAGIPDDVLHAPLVAATTNTAGNAHDKALDLLKVKLDAGNNTLTELSLRVASAALRQRQPDSAIGDFTASLPANLMLRQPHPSCAALRVGDYHVIGIRPTTPATPQTGASTEVMSITWTGGQMTVGVKGSAQTAILTPRSGAQCVFATPQGHSFIVAPSGLIVMTVPKSAPPTPATFYTAVALPVQHIEVSELAGKWQLYGSLSNEDDAGLHLVKTPTAQITLTPEGAAPEVDPSLRITRNSQGGFDMRGDVGTEDEYTDRLFAYRAGSGHLMMLLISAEGDFLVATPFGNLPMPEVGSTAVTWDMTISARNAFYASGPFGGQYTVKSADGDTLVRTTQSITVQNGLAQLSAPYDIALQFNAPQQGFVLRPPSTNAVRPIYPAEVLPLKGMGLAYSFVTGMPETGGDYFALSVSTPVTFTSFSKP